MSCLADVNFWLAWAVDDHVHHTAAVGWFEEQPDEDLAFCRITQNGFLRLVTNRHVMKGDALSPSDAWRAYDTLRSNPRVRFIDEPPGLEPAWRGLTRHSPKGHNFWTDAYLTAFAIVAGCVVLTFDGALAQNAGPHGRLLR